MPLIPNDDPAAFAELLGYLGEIGYGELYLRRPEGGAAGAAPLTAVETGAGSGATGPGAGRPAPGAAAAERAAGAVAPWEAGEEEEDVVRTVAELAASARRAAGLGPSATADGEAPGAAGAVGDPTAAAAAEAELAAIAAVVATCRKCRLCEGRQQTVFGAGNPHADLMFIGEGPGAEEDKRGLPFVGRAGELLTRIVEAIEMTRDEVYIANIVKCRPPGNRDPQPDEVAACRGYLERQIALIRPRFIVALGRIAAQTLLGNDLPIGRMRGQWFEIFGVPTMVTYHPAALLRNPALKRPTWEDMQLVRDRLRGA
jgi:DNA polymerase